ncbi:4-methyl-5(b-hydroxyethyl)-thiazole monophosphate biosynthesis [Verrucomicrobium sp. GAS474]|uniref:DJ-1 family glyoxalase III n=1 Tax=Verrucomicrobium sp. GAS474 TaxID=1882831 RepID=UPI00087ACCA2|nr:DJ-1 family glyoxalase III [Verrucomicrobium sp. GAS474]SDU26623.1 4-methyl-5(b-hydroxyethyl)-thiazole monophosphate biosynthesis [Verrucomicrobium sp. GAS474]
MSKTALVILAPGFEEIEAIATIDLLRRAGVEVTVAGTIPGILIASRKTRHLADIDLSDVIEHLYDLIVLPGGNDGVAHLKIDGRVKAIVERQIVAGRLLGMICAAPTLLLEWGFLPGEKVICHPSVQSQFPPERLAAGERVVTAANGNLITSLAAGSAVEFGYALVGRLLGPEAVEAVNGGVCAKLS